VYSVLAHLFLSLCSSTAVLDLQACCLHVDLQRPSTRKHAVRACDVSDPLLLADEETLTDQIAIKWKHRPDDCESFFKDKDIDLEFTVDWGDDWTVYKAEDVETANAIMSDILASLEGAGGPSSFERGSCTQCVQLPAMIAGQQ
jgi:hypothetical protein